MQDSKRETCIKQFFGLCGRGRGWDDLGEWHWNMYNIIYETNRQSRFDAWYRKLGAGALGWLRGMVWGGRWEGGSGWGTRVPPWQIHVDVWQNQYNIVKLKKNTIATVAISEWQGESRTNIKDQMTPDLARLFFFLSGYYFKYHGQGNWMDPRERPMWTEQQKVRSPKGRM